MAERPVRKYDNLWDAAIAESAEAEKNPGPMGSKMTRLEDISTIFVLGTKTSGKSTLIQTTTDKIGIPKPTLALDYTFVRRNIPDPRMPMHSIKEVGNIWELGGDALTFSQLIETPIKTNHALNKFAIFIVLDLSVPDKIWATLETIISIAKKAITKTLADNMRSSAEDLTRQLDENIKLRLGEDFQDKEFIEPFPLPVVIVGTKYDIFQNYEPEKRKLVCRILRLAAHRLGASLNFYSKNDVALNRRVKELLLHYAFGTPFPKATCQDPNKALMIPHGADSYEQIWPGSNPSQFTMDFLKHLFESQVGKYDEKLSIPEDPAEDSNFKEAEIDSRRNLILEDITLTEKVRKEYAKGDNVII